jgi:hypothetical protein
VVSRDVGWRRACGAVGQLVVADRAPAWRRRGGHAALPRRRRRETVRLLVDSSSAILRMERPRSDMRRTTSICSTWVRRTRVSRDCAIDRDLVEVVVVPAGPGLVRVGVGVFVDVIPGQERQPAVLCGVGAGGGVGGS